MIFVSVGEDDTCHLSGPTPQVRNVGNYHIDSQHMVFWEHYSRIHHDNGVTVFNQHHVEADFPETAKRD